MDFRDIVEFFKDAFKYIAVVIVVLLLFIFVMGLQQIVGPSMEPNLKEGDILIVNKLLYHIGKIKRNDIVVITEEEKYMVKRVVGLPGEHIEYKDNYVYVDGEKYRETFIDTEKVKTEDFKLEDLGYDKIPEGMYLVLGDNRENSKDSRDYGLVPKKQIVGKAWLRIWPFNKIRFF
ncbi:MAG: signal peptidase I [Bacilli bacterium]|nr:signal peptidase I [Bacilli bacterium]